MHTILYLDDEPDNLNVFKSTFRREYNIITAESPKKAFMLLREADVQLIIADFRMPEMTGVEFLKQSLAEFPDVSRILLTAYGERDVLINSINEAHIFSFVSKPWKREELKIVIDNAIENYELKNQNKELIQNLKSSNEKLLEANAEIKALKNKLEIENVYLRREIESTHQSDMVGFSSSLKSIKTKIDQVAPLNTTVLILGETGTGKELIARYIHKNSSRRDKTFVKLNCASLPASLVESELFGFEKGSFTGAMQSKAGLFEIADGGTIFLDEIGEMPMEVQAKLLRVIQDGEFYKIGGSKLQTVNVRIVAATNRELERAIDDGKFRSDLFYRLNIFPIRIPALRERVEDIPELVRFFISKFEKKLGLRIHDVPDKVLTALKSHAWPGNIRELEGLIERSMIMSSDGVLELSDWSIQGHVPQPRSSVKELASADGSPMSLSDMERQHILNTLIMVDWKISGRGGAAEILKLNHNTLRSKMVKLGIRPD